MYVKLWLPVATNNHWKTLGTQENKSKYAKKYANKVGMMHESEGQHIGKAPSLHLFHVL